MLLLERQFAAFTPCCVQEERDKDAMLCALRTCPDAFTRENETAHFTASAWIVDAARAHFSLSTSDSLVLIRFKRLVEYSG